MAKYYKVWFFFSTENTIDYKCWMRENLRVRATKLEKEPKRKKTTFINTSLKIMTKWKKNYSNLYLENNFSFYRVTKHFNQFFPRKFCKCCELERKKNPSIDTIYIWINKIFIGK